MGYAYYNDNCKYVASWLQNLISEGLIAPGDVDDRSISDVMTEDLKGYSQCHFFAGIGGWSRALRLASISDSQEIWTGSCPCQPFSVAGKGGGFSDERHIWPEFFRLIKGCRPPLIMGEQVASKIALNWIDTVFNDLEEEGYSCRAADLCAAGVGAYHIRQRLWWVAHTGHGNERVRHKVGGEEDEGKVRNDNWNGSEVGSMANPYTTRSQIRGVEEAREIPQPSQDGTSGGGVWGDPDWIYCRDGKHRPVDAGTFPLANGVSNRMAKLRAIGNSIVPQVAAEVIKAFLG
jgi:DNA (cytosine-5)-methyltransferase 1